MPKCKYRIKSNISQIYFPKIISIKRIIKLWNARDTQKTSRKRKNGETCQQINHRCLEEIKKVEADFNYFHNKSEGCNLNSLLVCDKAHQTSFSMATYIQAKYPCYPLASRLRNILCCSNQAIRIKNVDVHRQPRGKNTVLINSLKRTMSRRQFVC